MIQMTEKEVLKLKASLVSEMKETMIIDKKTTIVDEATREEVVLEIEVVLLDTIKCEKKKTILE